MTDAAPAWSARYPCDAQAYSVTPAAAVMLIALPMFAAACLSNCLLQLEVAFFEN